MTDPPSSPPPDGSRAAWAGLITVAGAATGLTALVYFVGAVTMWARFRAAGLPADVAIEHHPRGALLAVGTRGVLAIAGIVAAVALAAYLVALLSSRIAERFGRPRPAGGVLDAWAARIRNARRARVRLLVLVGLAVIALAGFFSWRWFGVSIALVASGAAIARYVHQRGQGRRRPSLALVVLTLLAAGVAAIGWQVQAPVLVQTVTVTPVPGAETAALAPADGSPLPYFGETGAYVYVGELTGDTSRIFELPRSSVLLSYPAEKFPLYPKLDAPWSGLRRAIGRSL